MHTKMLNIKDVNRRSYRFLVGVLAIGLSVGACSSDSDDGITEDTTLTPGAETTGIPAAGADNGGTNDTSIDGTLTDDSMTDDSTESENDSDE